MRSSRVSGGAPDLDMIEEVLKKIRETEESAAAGKRAAEERAADLRAKADGDYRAAVESGVKAARENSDRELESARKAADEEYDRVIALTRAECEKLIADNEPRAARLATTLAGRLKDGDI